MYMSHICYSASINRGKPPLKGELKMKYKYVCVYEVSREYGGPEEGGWYYDAGTLIKVMPVTRSKWAKLSRKVSAWCKLRNKESRPRYSVLDRTNYEVRDFYRSIEKIPESFPEKTPHYE